MSYELTDWSREYPLDLFQEEAVNQQDTPTELGLIPDHVDIDQLAIPEKIRELIRHGDDLEAPRGTPTAHYPSRSEVLHAVDCGLARANISAETIISIITDPKYRISESVLEKANPLQYAKRQVEAAIQAVSTGWPDVTNKGKPRSTYANAFIALRRLPVHGENDVFHHRKTLNGRVMQQYQGELTDDLCAVLRQEIIRAFGFDPGKANLIEATNYLCLENSHHPVIEYLASLKWDGVPRIDTWLSTYLSAEDTPLNRAISRITLIAAVRRIREPGVKFDYILVFEGPQGSGKSTAIRVLAGDENFSDQDILTLDPKQQAETLEGAWLFEISELSGLNRQEVAKVKSFASRQVDRVRPAYARFREDRPRQTIFIGTTNEDTYLRDTTGNRRFWPVKTGSIDLGALRRDRDQLWAEAAKLESENGSIALPPDLWEAAAEQQEARMEVHPWLDVLSSVTGWEIINDKARITTQQIFEALDIYAENRQPYQEKVIAGLMRQIGWTGPKNIKSEGRPLRGYERPATDADRESVERRKMH